MGVDFLILCYWLAYLKGVKKGKGCNLFLFVNRISSQEIPSDVTVHAGGTPFPLHKVKISNSALASVILNKVVCFNF